ncbi:OsmC family peroxiredoxin [candidate division GN15 bacterium]|nr:OsmC family peroxiredoxin [candidate division GN15 bacterium]
MTKNAQAHWEGSLKQGKGNMQVGSGSYNSEYEAASRFESGNGTNPEELIGAAHAGCYSMSLAKTLTEAGHEPKRVDTKAAVELEKSGDGFQISTITLTTEAEVPGMDENVFTKLANQARDDCVVSKALKGVTIDLKTNLRS